MSGMGSTGRMFIECGVVGDVPLGGDPRMMANCRQSCHSCQGGDRAWKLRTHIASTYSNQTDNSTRIVRVESIRVNSIDIDEPKQIARVAGRMVLSWNDSAVSWDKDQWGLSWLNFYWIHIWSPQIIQINGGTVGAGTVSGKVLAANYTGQVYLWLDFNFNAKFDFQYEDYPNDYQTICYKFDDKRVFAVQFTVAKEIQDKESKNVGHLSGWTLSDIRVSASRFATESLSDWRRNPYDVQSSNGQMCIGLKRNAVYYTTEMLLPWMLCSVLCVVAVVLPLSRAPLLVGFSFGCQLISLLLVSQRLPSYTTHTPSILKYAGVSLILTCMLLISEVLLSVLARSASALPPPHRVASLVAVVQSVIPPPPAKEGEGGWSASAHALHHLIFAMATLVYLFSAFVYLIL